MVHARRGTRNLYRPLHGRGPASQPEMVINSLLGRRSFSLFYVADLDAIEGRADHKHCLLRLARRFPTLRFWVDQGRRDGCVPNAGRCPNLRGVIGSESGLDPGQLAALKQPPAALSLDFRGSRFLGDATLLEHPECWPDTVILLDLERTGGMMGTDLERLEWLRRRAAGRTLLIGGGVSGPRDLAHLRAAGADGALVATALHQGRLN